MTRRWSLIALIAALAVALGFVVVDLVGGSDSGKKETSTADDPAAGTPEKTSLQGVGWWPAHDGAEDRAGSHDATLEGGTSWTKGPNGGALQLDGSTGYADTGDRIIDTDGKDYSVAARVRLNTEKDRAFRTAVSQDGKGASVFYLQYSGEEKRFAFSRVGARAVARETGKPDPDRWYHLVGTYSSSEKQMKLYVDGEFAGEAEAAAPKQPSDGNLVIGRGLTHGRPADFWKGSIADVHAYDKALSAEEAASLAAHEPS